jgi:hypothetical protein
LRAAERRQRTDRFREGDLEREAVGAFVHGVEPTLKGRGAHVSWLELREADRAA